MRRQRKTWIAALALLIAGVLAVLWLGRSAWAPAQSPQIASVVQAEKDRQRRQADAASQQAQEREAAEDRRRREAAILQALQKQTEADAAAKRKQAEADNLAATERLLEQQRKYNAGIVQASEQQAAAHLRRQEEDRRLADTVRALEQERVRTAIVVQASLKPQADSAQKLSDAVPAAAPAGKVQPASPVRVAAAEAKVSPAAAPARKSSRRTGSAGRTKVARTPRVAHRAPAVAEPCPLRWLDAVLTDMHRRLSARA